MKVRELGIQVLFGVVVVYLFPRVEGFNVLAYWALNGSEPGLTLHGGPTFVEGHYPGSKAINFNQPSNCFAQIPKVELRGRNFTIALWINVKNILSRLQVFFSDWHDPWQFYAAVNQGLLVFQRHSSGLTQWYPFQSKYPVIDAGKWIHVAISWDQMSGIVKLYKDGYEVGHKTYDITTSTWYGPTRDRYDIGDDGHSDTEHQFLGSVMDLYIIDGALDREQLISLIGTDVYLSTNYLNNTLVYTNETLYCQAYSFPTPYVAWVRSGVVLVNKTSAAEIKIRKNDGKYECVASNGLKETKKALFEARAPFKLCHEYDIISDVSRAVSTIYLSSQVKDDNKHIDLSKWYRIQSPAGNQLPTTCVPQNRCGAQSPGWLNGPHPRTYDGIETRVVCFHFNGDCCYQNTTVQIRKCFGFYVYKFGGIPKGLPARYCMVNQQDDKQDSPYSTFATTKDGQEALVNHVMYSEADVNQFVICMNYCILSSECRSFNYSKKKKICELNNATKQQHPASLMKNDHFAYYEKLLVKPAVVN